MTRNSHKTLVTTEEIAAYLHRSRMDILQVLQRGRATASQIAAQLDVHPANLTRHLRVLEKAGLINLVERRDTGRNLEKYYAASAQTFDVCPEADALTSPHKIAMAFARSDLSAALARLPDDDPGPVLVRLIASRIPRRKVKAFIKELTKLSERFDAAAEEKGDVYHMVLAAYPGDEKEPNKDQRIHLNTEQK